MFGKSNGQNGQLHDEHRGVAPSRETKIQPGGTPEAISTLGPGMAIIGKIDCQGTLHIFGRIQGELRATNVLIGNGAQFDGSVIAQGVTIDGRLKGTIHATRVNLQSNAVVDGDIFHRVLSIDENAQFEGSSRRVENPTDRVENPTDRLENPTDRGENPTDSGTSGLKLDWSRAEPIRFEAKKPLG